MIGKQLDVWAPRPRDAADVVEAASGHYGWALHVIEDYPDEPSIEQSKALLRVLRATSVLTEVTRRLPARARERRRVAARYIRRRA